MNEEEGPNHANLNQVREEAGPDLHGALSLEVAWEGEAVRCVLAEEGPSAPTVLPRRLRSADRAAVDNASAQIYSALQAAAYGRTGGAAGLEKVQHAGRELFDLLLDPETKSALLETRARYLTIKLDDRLVDVPWELIHDGQQFLSARFALGRLVMTELPAPQSGRMRECRRRPTVAVFGGGGDDLGALWQETHGIDEALADYPYRVGVRLEATAGSFKQALRKAEVIHFSGHAEFNPQKPEQSALLFAHGERLTAEEIGHALAGVEKVPRLVFLNACGSGRSGEWTRECAKAAYGLGNAFLLRGVGHVIATFCDVADGTSAQVGEAFYSHLVRGATIGEALQQARRRDGGEGAWAAAYALYGSPYATLQGEEHRTAVRAGFEPRQLPSGRTLSALDRMRVDAYSTRQETQLLTLVLVELLNSHGTDPSSKNLDATERAEGFRRTVRQCLAEHPSIEEITCVEELFLIAAVTPSDAVRLALMVQSSTRDMLRPGPEPSGVRIALHLGEVGVKNPEDPSERRDLFGYQVDLANRVLDIATVGQILMTRPVFDNARAILRDEDFPGVGDVSWLDHGAYRLQGVEEPVGICEAGEKGWAPVAPPADSEKAHRYVAPDQEPVLGWRPALDHPIPGTGWVLTEKLGEGGFGEVWRARHKSLKETRVFKFCFREDRVRFLKREVTLFRLLKEKVGEHPNVVRIHDVFFGEPPYYIGMEDVPGGALPDWWKANGGDAAIPMETRVEIAAQVADALQAAHEAGIIHRDVKPSNILISGTGTRPEQVRVKLTDFGIGQLAFEESFAGTPLTGFTDTFQRTEIVSRSGTRLYAAPEVLAGQRSSTRSDIYSLGVVLYQLLAGDFLRPASLDWGKDVDDPVLAEDLARCFAGDPEQRFASAAQLSENLRSLEERRRAFEERERAERTAARRRRVTRVSVTVSAVLLFLALALAYGLRREQIQRAKTERELYRANIRLAMRHIEEQNIFEAKSLLSECPAEYRHWEWGHLQYLCNQDVKAVKAHDAPVIDVACRPDGNQIATAGDDGSVKLWDGNMERVLLTVPGCNVAYSADGNLLAVGGAGEKATVFDSRTGQVIRELTLGLRAGGLALSHEGELVAALGSERGEVWNVTTGELLYQFSGTLKDCAFSPDGRYLAITDYWSVKVLDATTGEVLNTQSEHFHAASCLVFGADSQHVISSSWAGELVRWNFLTGEIRKIPRWRSSAASMDISPDGKRVAVGDSNRTVTLYALDSLDEIGGIGQPITHAVECVAFSADGKYLIAGGGLDGKVRFWDLDRLDPRRVFRGHTGNVNWVAFSSNGKKIATAAGDWNLDNDRTARIWDVSTGALLHELVGHEAPVSSVAFSPDDSLVASSGRDRFVKIWSATAGTVIRTIESPAQSVPSIAFSPDGQSVAGGEEIYGSTICARIWDRASGRLLRKLPGHTDRVVAVAYSPDGRLLATGSWDRTIKLWDTETGQQVGELKGHGDRVSCVAFSRDGKTLASGSYDRTAKLWDVGTGKQLKAFTCYRSTVDAISFSPDGKRLITVTRGEKTRIWDVETGRELLTLSYLANEYAFARFSPCGRMVALTEGHNTVILPSFPWKEDDYPGDESTPLEERIELYKREYWEQPARPSGEAQDLLGVQYVTDWWVIGPFDNTGKYRFSYPHPPEKEINLGGTYAGMRQDIRWKRLAESVRRQEVSPGSFVHLHHLYDPDEYVAAYALTYMYSPEDRNLVFLLGSDDSVRFWLNDELLWSNRATRSAWPDQDVVGPVLVPQGWNKILLRISDNNSGAWGFYFRATDEEYHVLHDLKFDPMRGEEQ